MKLFLAAAVLTAIAFAALGLNIIFRKGGKFPETEVGRNKRMRDLGISCPKCDEMNAWREMNRQKRKKINPSELKLDLTNRE
jgi:hypothetical protein